MKVMERAMQFGLVLLIAAATAVPQRRPVSTPAELRGHTQDRNHKALSNVVLTLYECSELQSGKCEKTLASTTSHEDGTFTLKESDVKPGVYSLMAELAPFLPKMKIPVNIPNDNAKSFDFVMQIEARTAGRLEGLSGEDAEEVYAAAKIKKEDELAILAAAVMKENGLDATKFFYVMKNRSNQSPENIQEAQYQPVTQAEIRFHPGQNTLSQSAKDALDEMAISLKNQRGYIVEVKGFSPDDGTVGIEKSREIAQLVVRYLVLNHDVPIYRIYTVGMGNAPIQTENGGIRRPNDGRVEITLLKSNVENWSSTTEDPPKH